MDGRIKITENPEMKIGVGIKEHRAALAALGCDHIVTPEDLAVSLASPIPSLRKGDHDVITVIDPKILDLVTIKRIVDADVLIEVAGHKPSAPQTYDERRQFRMLKPTIEGQPVPDGRGRRPDHEVIEAHIQAMLNDWHAGEVINGKWKAKYTPKAVMDLARSRTGISELPDFWAKNTVKARTGSVSRNPSDPGKTKLHSKEGKRRNVGI